jgi:hypothetical protein
MMLGIWDHFGLLLAIWFHSDLYIPGCMSVTTGNELGYCYLRWH